MPAPPDMFRSILLENDLAKQYHKWIRIRLMIVAEHSIKDSHGGRLPGRGTDLASLVYESLKFVTEALPIYSNKLSHILSAYYSTIRQILIKIAQGDDDRIDRLDYLLLPLALNERLRATSHDPGLLDQHVSDKHRLSTLADRF